MYEELIGTTIDKTNEAYADFPEFLNSHIFLGYDNGFITQAPEVVPDSVTIGQFRAGLIITGLDSSVQAVIDSIEDELERKLAQSDFEYRGYIERNHRLVLQISIILNLSSKQVDQYFIDWSKL